MPKKKDSGDSPRASISRENGADGDRDPVQGPSDPPEDRQPPEVKNPHPAQLTTTPAQDRPAPDNAPIVDRIQADDPARKNLPRTQATIAEIPAEPAAVNSDGDGVNGGMTNERAIGGKEQSGDSQRIVDSPDNPMTDRVAPSNSVQRSGDRDDRSAKATTQQQQPSTESIGRTSRRGSVDRKGQLSLSGDPPANSQQSAEAIVETGRRASVGKSGTGDGSAKEVADDGDAAEQNPQRQKQVGKRNSSRNKAKGRKSEQEMAAPETGTGDEPREPKGEPQQKPKNRRKSRGSRSSLGDKPAVIEDPETVEIKERIKQFANDIRASAAVGKSPPEVNNDDDDDDDKAAPNTTRRLSADAAAFVPMTAANPTTTSTQIPATAVFAPEFVPTNPAAPVVPRENVDQVGAEATPAIGSGNVESESTDVVGDQKADGGDRPGIKERIKLLQQQGIAVQGGNSEDGVGPGNGATGTDAVGSGSHRPEQATGLATDRIRQLNTASGNQVEQGIGEKSTNSGKLGTYLSVERASSGQEIDVDSIDLEEVLEAPCASMQIIKKPIEVNKQGSVKKGIGHQHLSPATSPEPESTPDTGGSTTASKPAKTAPKPLNQKDRSGADEQIERALRGRTDPRPKQLGAFTSSAAATDHAPVPIMIMNPAERPKLKKTSGTFSAANSVTGPDPELSATNAVQTTEPAPVENPNVVPPAIEAKSVLVVETPVVQQAIEAKPAPEEAKPVEKAPDPKADVSAIVNPRPVVVDDPQPTNESSPNPSSTSCCIIV